MAVGFIDPDNTYVPATSPFPESCVVLDFDDVPPVDNTLGTNGQAIMTQLSYLASLTPGLIDDRYDANSYFTALDFSNACDTDTLTDFSCDFTEVMWSSAYVQEMRDRLAEIRAGDFAISADIWAQIFDRATRQVRREALTREREGNIAWARLGWDMPGGVALGAQELAAQNINEAASAAALEQAVQESLQKEDQFQKAVVQGKELESLMAEVHSKFYDRQVQCSVAGAGSLAGAEATVQAAKIRGCVDLVVGQNTLLVEQQKAAAQAYTQQAVAALGATSEASKSAANTYAQVASALYNSFHLSQSVSCSQVRSASDSNSYSYTSSDSTSTNQSSSESTNFSHVETCEC